MGITGRWTAGLAMFVYVCVFHVFAVLNML